MPIPALASSRSRRRCRETDTPPFCGSPIAGVLDVVWTPGVQRRAGLPRMPHPAEAELFHFWLASLVLGVFGLFGAIVAARVLL